MERRPILREAEPLYTALAKASLRARRDPGWGYVRARLNEATSLFEDLVRAGHAIACRPHEYLDPLVRGVAESVEKSDSDAMKAILELEENMRPLAARLEVASSYARTARIVAGLLLIVAGASLIASAATGLQLALAALTTAMGLAAGLLASTTYSDTLLLAGLALIAAYSLLAPPPSTALLAGLGVGIALPLPAALRRLIAGGPGGPC